MNLLESQNRINDLMSAFVTQVKGSTAVGRTDINRVSEMVLIPLFTEVYDYKDLKNLNHTEGPNYPGIDLGDESARIAFQITATPDSDKVKDALRKFVYYELYKKFDRLIVYILTEKQKSYSSNAYKEITQGKFIFDADRDILDYRDILREIAAFQIDKARTVQDILEANLGEGLKASKTSEKLDEIRQVVKSIQKSYIKTYTYWTKRLIIPDSSKTEVSEPNEESIRDKFHRLDSLVNVYFPELLPKLEELKSSKEKVGAVLITCVLVIDKPYVVREEMRKNLSQQYGYLDNTCEEF